EVGRHHALWSCRAPSPARPSMIAQPPSGWQDGAMPTIITVQGSFTAWHPAERATAHLTVSFDGPERSEVLEAATRSVQTVIETVTALHDPDAGPVTWY